MPGGIMLVLVLLALVASGIKVVREYERLVVFRLGRLVGPRGPGITFVIPAVERAQRLDLRTITMDIPSQDVITKDNVSVKVNAVLYFRVIDPNRSVVEVENYLFATSQNAQTTLRSVCGEAELDELLGEREKINTSLQGIIDQAQPVATRTDFENRIRSLERFKFTLLGAVFVINGAAAYIEYLLRHAHP